MKRQANIYFKDFYWIGVTCLCLAFNACMVYKMPYESAGKMRHIYMTNEVVFKNESQIKYLGSGFLIEHNNNLYACTAKHIVEKSKRIKPSVKAPKLNEELDIWTMFPRKKERPKIVLDSLINAESNKEEWWIFSVKKAPKKIQALEPRFEDVTVGEKVFFVGCPYSETGCKQNIYTGKIKSIKGKRITVDYEPKTNVAGFSGAALMDENGKLIGILTQATFDKKTKTHSSVVAESTAYLKEVLDELD